MKEQPEYLVLGLEFKHLANCFCAYCPMFGTKVIWWTHGYNIHMQNNGLRYRLDRAVKTFVMKHSYRVLLYTEYCMSQLVGNGIPENKIIILNNALNEEPIQGAFAAVRPEEIDRINSSSFVSQKTITFIGRLTLGKNPELMLDLAHKLKQTLQTCVFSSLVTVMPDCFLRRKSRGLECRIMCFSLD
jgi:glycosyltransferase involved in cell wall biosynthesis